MRHGGDSRQQRACSCARLLLTVTALVAGTTLGCGRLRYEPRDAGVDASSMDAAGDANALDAASTDASTDTPMPDDGALDDSALDASALDAPRAADAPDARADAGAPVIVLPAECTRGPMPTGVALPTVPPLPPRGAGRVIPVSGAMALSMALSTALADDIIELEPGATYGGSFVVDVDRVTVRTRGFDAAVPSSRRVTPSDAPAMARIVSSSSTTPLQILADDVSLVGLEIATTAGDSGALVHGEGGRRLLVDRCFVHGNATGSVRAGVQLDGPGSEVRRSWIDEIHSMAGPRPAVLLYRSGGPIAVLDSHLESAGEGVVLGTEMAPATELSPHDIALCGNHVTRSLTWYPRHPSFTGTPWPPGPLIGIYNAQRVLVAGNELERAWAGGSGGRAFALGPGDFAPAGSATVSDVVLVWNHVRDVPEGISLFAGDAGLAPLARVHVGQSVFEPIVLDRFDAVTGRILQIVDGAAGPVSGIVLDRITAPGAIENGIVTDTAGADLVVRDSILALGEFGFLGGAGEGVAGIAGLDHLVLIGARNPARYGPTSTVVALEDVGFVEVPTADWELSPSSPFLTAAASGGPAGCDVRALRTVLAGVAP